MALPFVLLAIAIVAAVGPSLPVLILTLGLTGWVSFAKLVRGRVLELREEDYVQAAVSLGASTRRVLLRHVLPNVAPLLLVDGTLQLGTLILAEAGLSFLGLGIQPPTPSWGGILSEGQIFIAVAWWIPTLPGVALLLTILSVNLLGDALRDALSPGD
jgi:peptide/nickel transport system permease protein